MVKMRHRSASAAALFAAAVSLPTWVVFVCKCIIAFADDFNPAAVLAWSRLSVVFALPFGWIVGFLVSPAIYRGYNLSGLRRYGRTMLVHAGMGVVVIVLSFLTGIHSYLDVVAIFPVVCGPMLVVPSLVGTLVYAYATSPAARESSA